MVTITLEIDTSNFKAPLKNCVNILLVKFFKGINELKCANCSQSIFLKKLTWRSFYWTPGSIRVVHQDMRLILVCSPHRYHFTCSKGRAVVDLIEHQTRGGTRRRYSNYANYLVVLQSDDTTGEYVIPGQKIGDSGNTGFSSLPHFHFAAIKPGLLTSINHCLLF